MKKFRIILYIITLILLITACAPNNRTPVSAEEFKSKMIENGFKITNSKDQYKGYNFIKKVYTANNGFKILFYEINTKNNAQLLFQNNQSIFADNKDSSYTEESQSKGNYERYSLSNADKFYFISRVDNTILYIDIKASHKEDAEQIIENLGY